MTGGRLGVRPPGETSSVVSGWQQPAVAPPVTARRIESSAVGAGTRLVGRPDAALPTLEEIERGRREAYELGYADGRAAGLDEASRRAAELHSQLSAALDRARSELVADRRVLLEGVTDLALEMATLILGRTPGDEGVALAERIRELCLTSPQVIARVEVSAADVGAVTAAVASSGITVEVAADLRPGETRVLGDWSSAVSTVDTMGASIRDAARRALSEQPDHAGEEWS
jgi:hypothetical protein